MEESGELNTFFLIPKKDSPYPLETELCGSQSQSEYDSEGMDPATAENRTQTPSTESL
jgi:hypothetical protein